MNYTIYQVDAFTDTLFGGNPAAVVPLTHWIDDSLMQKLAMENNLSETVFFVPSVTTEADYEIRWFTPVLEINLCGHATLASADILFNKLGYSKDMIRFQCKSGLLNCRKKDDIIIMDFPAWKPEPVIDDYSHIVQALGNTTVKGIYKNRDVLFELGSEEMVRTCAP